MFKLGILALVVIGCGEVTPAGGIGLGGAGGTTETDASGSAGAAGGQAGTGQAGAGGAPLASSCNIQIGHITGTDVMAVWKRCSTTNTATVNVVDGAVFNFFNAADWTVASSTIWPHSGGTVGEPTTDGLCDVDIRFEMPTALTTCTTPDRLFVHLTVPAI